MSDGSRLHQSIPSSLALSADAIRAQLLDAQFAYERGEIDEEQLAAIEETLLQRLEVP